MTSTTSYKDLIVWQKAMDLALLLYELTEDLPSSEQFGLKIQIRRAAVSVPSNIAEGRYRNSQKDYKRFLQIAYASGAEIETQLELVKRLHLIPHADFTNTDTLLNEVMRILNVMVRKLPSN